MKQRHTAASAATAPAETSVAADVAETPAATAATPTAATASIPKPSSKDDVQGAMLEPSLANNQWVRALAGTAAAAAAAVGSGALPSQGAAFVHLLAYGLLLGTLVWNTFFVGLTMFKNMPRQMFGRVQAKLFPQFFGLTTGAVAVLLAGAVGGWGCGAAVAAASSARAVLGGALALSLANWLFIEPKCTGLMFARYDLENKQDKSEEDAAAIKALYSQFGKWHGISSLNNLLVLCATLAYGYTLAGRLALAAAL